MTLFGSKKSKFCHVVVGFDLDSFADDYLQYSSSEHVLFIVHQEGATSPTIHHIGHKIMMKADLRHHQSMREVFKKIQHLGFHAELVIFQPIQVLNKALEEMSSADMVKYWQFSGLSAINIAQKAIAHMLQKKSGTLIFLSNPQHAHLKDQIIAHTSMNEGIRALSQSLAREFHPKGIHIVYCEVNELNNQNQQAIRAIVDTCQHIHAQPRSTWSQDYMLI